MKKITLLLMVVIAAINMFAATITIPEEAKAWNIPAEAIDVLQAREICAGLEADVPTTKMYYVMGYVKRVSSKNAETVSQYGQARFYLENVKGANSEEEFDAYQVYGLNGVKINNPDVVAAGDFVVLYGPLTKHQYEGGDVTYQTPGKGAAYIWNSTNPKLHNDTGTTPDTPETPEEPVAKVVTVAEFNAAPEATDVYYELTGTIGGTINTTYGNFDLTDETGTVYVYGLTKEFIAVGSTKNDQSYASLGLKEGDKITIRGFRGSYNGKIEVMGAYFVKLVEAGSGETPDQPEEPETPDTPVTPENPEGAIVFDADVDQGNAGTDSNNAAEYSVTKEGVTMTVSSGILGTYNNEMHYRIYKNQTLVLTSTVGNITSVQFTCTANNDEKYGPGCFTVDGGDYTYSGAVGTWTGDAATITFTASANQVRATQIVVTLVSATAVENVTVGATPVKVIENGQVLIIRGEHIYNVLGAQVK